MLTPGFCAGDDDTQTLVFIRNLLHSVNGIQPSLKLSIVSFHYPFSAHAYKWNGNDVFPLNGRNSKVKKIFTWIKAVRKLKVLHAEQSIDAVFCCWLGECSLVGKWFASRRNIPFLCWAAGQDARPDNRFLKWLKVAPDNVAVIGDKQIDWLAMSAISCTKKIENGLPVDFRESTATDYTLDIFAAGSLIPLKNYGELIAVIEQAKKIFPSVRCEIAGDGPERESLQRRVENAGLSANIIFCGALPHSTVMEKMRSALVFFHPSVYEGNSTVILEAAGNGNLILCREEISLYKDPFIFNYSSVAEAAETLIRLIQENRKKPEGRILSSSRKQAANLLNYLGLH